MIDSEARETRAWSMLTARAQQYEVGSRSFDGLTPSQVAAMLAGLDERPYTAGMLCEAGDWLYLPRVASYLYQEALTKADKWNLPGGVSQVRSLVYLSILEATVKSVECVACNGTGITADVAGVRSACELCRGRARLPAIQETRAALLEVNESNWTRTWRERYYEVDEVLRSWITLARDHMRDALSGRQPEGMRGRIRRLREIGFR